MDRGDDLIDIECEGLPIDRSELERNCSDMSEKDVMIREPLLRKRNTTSQIAIVGANVCPIESLDYEIIENDLFKQDWRSRKKVQIFQYIVLKWTFALLIGLITGLVGFFNNLAVENIAGFKLLLTSNLLLQEKYLNAFLAYAGCNVVLAASAAVLCAYVAPAAAGSGIPEVKAYLNGVDAYSILAPSTLFVKIFGSILGVSAGFVLGKEGPMVHTGACIASLLGQGGSRKYHLTWRGLRYFKNDRDRRDLITCGAAAGVAAAFRAPVGGVLFALEEAASWWRSALLWRTFFTTAVVAVVLRGFIEYCQSGKCGLFGQGGLIMFDVSSAISTYSTQDLLVVIILGIIGGIFGSLYNYLVDKVLRTYSIINEKGALFKVALVIAISLLTSCCSYGFPWFARCTPCPVGLEEQCPTIGRSGNFKNFQCPAGHYNDLASLFLNTNDDAIRNLFSSRTKNEFYISSLLIFFASVYCLGIITYGIAVPSGLFIPVILAGASYGRLVGHLLESISDLDVGLFALLGAASFLGGTMRMTVSLCVILLELTNDILMLPLVMLVLLISKTVADNFNKGVYDQIVKMKGFPFMESHAEPYMRNLIAGDVVSGPLITFAGVERVGNILHALKWTGHNGFPVIDEPPFSDVPELVGLVLKSHLLVLLKGKKFSRERVSTGDEISQSFDAFDFAKAGSGKGVKLEDLDITEEEMEMYVDLHPISNASPYTVVETMSLAKAALLFRELGLRHLCVVPKTPGRPPIAGILTRHDFMPEHVLGLYPHFKPTRRRIK
ncbi:chloride channel protein CLC-c-like [Macadamia integrifolia]|uniref:chloride channel protein CLC-c-like n=1 Tax=Macadamia integrifolia TaxID=60698 RepID=UPI001C4F47E4|nr:chloride channel protein CLC-c-like [Macadamia integrifolia]XP_042516981.1 chloride channel protein CLC-c-like [Macadamia integrifolia]